MSKTPEIPSSPQNLTPEDIFNELQKIANLSEDFRDGVSDTFDLHLTLGDPISEEHYLKSDTPDALPYHTESVSFDAKRLPIDGEEVLTFEYSHRTTYTNQQLPLHLAKFTYPDYPDPVQQAGFVTMEEAADVTIDSDTMMLDARMNVMYIDEDDDVIVETSSKLDSEVTQTVFPIQTAIENTDGNTLHVRAIDTPDQFSTSAAETVEYIAGGRAALESFISEFSADYDAAVEERNLAVATLRSLQRILRKNLGIRFE